MHQYDAIIYYFINQCFTYNLLYRPVRFRCSDCMILFRDPSLAYRFWCIVYGVWLMD
jgi:hypothetical protein